jgi:uncharacterized membrane protein YeaQ/YmgE (transglycosylase-associated protein family)
MHLLWTILIGFVIGLLARALKPGRDAVGFIATTVIGIGGALLATYVGQQAGWYAQGDRAGFLASIGGAVVLLIVYELGRRLLARNKAE